MSLPNLEVLILTEKLDVEIYLNYLVIEELENGTSNFKR